MGSGKPPLPHHPPQNVPIHSRARAEEGGMNGLPGPLTQPPKVGPTGRHLCNPISGTSNQQGGVQGLVLQNIQAQEATRIPTGGLEWMEELAALKGHLWQKGGKPL